jgi:hypothetical protein
MLLATKGLSTWFVHVPLAVHPSWSFLLFALTWVHPSCTFSSPFVGHFVVLTFGRFSSLSLSIGICGKCFLGQISKAMPPKSSSYFNFLHIPNTNWDSITLNCTKRLLQLLRAAPNNNFAIISNNASNLQMRGRVDKVFNYLRHTC